MDFGFNETEESKDKKLYLKHLDKSFKRISSIKDLLGQLPKEGESIRLVTTKSFNTLALLLYLVKYAGRVEDMYITTFRMNRHSITAIKNLVKSGKVKKLTLVISSVLKKNYLEEFKRFVSESKEVKIIFAYNHSKVIAARTSKGFYTITGSGNLSDNARIEIQQIESCKEVFNFHKDWIDDIKNISATKDLTILE